MYNPHVPGGSDGEWLFLRDFKGCAPTTNQSFGDPKDLVKHNLILWRKFELRDVMNCWEALEAGELLEKQ